MQSHLALLLPVAAVWLAAGYLADGLPACAMRASCVSKPAGCSR